MSKIVLILALLIALAPAAWADYCPLRTHQQHTKERQEDQVDE